MLELGVHSAGLHAGLAEAVAGASPDLVFLGGTEMQSLAEAMEKVPHLVYRADVDALGALVVDAVRAGDVIMVKSSNGAGFSRIVDALTRRYPPRKAADA
jgi:UDP-N-acetylmuramoyl-tripeptide--D-alanyl-D-alanine ligase